MKTVLVAGGTVEDDFALAYQKQQQFEYKIAVDGGISFFYRNGQVPDLLVGDFDSAEKQMLDYFTEENIPCERHDPQKDATDTELALCRALELGSTEIHILGGTGTRLDHTLGNIRVLGLALEKGVPCYLVNATNRIRLVAHEAVLQRKEQYGRYVSILPFTTSLKGLTLRGFQYPLEQAVMEGYHALGVSNEILAPQAVITLEEGVAIVIESKDAFR